MIKRGRIWVACSLVLVNIKDYHLYNIIDQPFRLRFEQQNYVEDNLRALKISILINVYNKVLIQYVLNLLAKWQLAVNEILAAIKCL